MVLNIFSWLLLPLLATCNDHKVRSTLFGGKLWLESVQFLQDEKWQLQETSLENYPYIAAVKGNELCNGVLVTPEFVLTPASCVCRWVFSYLFYLIILMVLIRLNWHNGHLFPNSEYFSCKILMGKFHVRTRGNT